MAEDNATLLKSKRESLLPNHRFDVWFGNDLCIGFSQVSNLSDHMEQDVIVEGGRNNAVHVFTKPSQQPDTTTFEHGMVTKGVKADQLNLKVGDRLAVNVTITVLEPDMIKEARTFFFENGVVVKWELGGLDAKSGEVLIERLEIAHGGLQEYK
ncbi:MAG: phage tail protein [Syntrophomonadaceae bacterium]|nr:phage tail protein [Syntrophomonadaceae bacterium]